ncbi:MULTISPECIES: hypothetical protein [Fervidobacterium]|uniref:Uncharacterized protein n=2 Tax=Fervidobacterium TaxID=2422 RepID=A7HNI4_FERNB|nr:MULTISPECIES: hypothetical protein [Fervidobacterium]ABS61467.1 hypothetical protein Fnod_1632 [Fervidobacterium nodosum Rt17-B1]AMW33301.1 hypothetical protein NA23_08680 [Fervidobacterium islandicum]KAF2961084.1 hypothetical protein AS161_02620 [Fervidobacterium sp. 2310opik-2]
MERMERILFGKFIGDVGMMTILVKAEELDNLPNWIWIDCEEDSQKPDYVLFEILDSVPEVGEIDGNIYYIYGEFNEEKYQHAEPITTFQDYSIDLDFFQTIQDECEWEIVHYLDY